MSDEFVFYPVDPAEEPGEQSEIKTFLARAGLSYEEGIEVFVVGRQGRNMIACGGLEKNIVKCVAIDPLFRGENLSLKVVNEVLHLAFERGCSHLFLYTRPNNIAFFAGCGFSQDRRGAGTGDADGKHADRHPPLLRRPEDAAPAGRQDRFCGDQRQSLYPRPSLSDRAGGRGLRLAPPVRGRRGRFVLSLSRSVPVDQGRRRRDRAPDAPSGLGVHDLAGDVLQLLLQGKERRRRLLHRGRPLDLSRMDRSGPGRHPPLCRNRALLPASPTNTTWT